jgi:hypothetical protein
MISVAPRRKAFFTVLVAAILLSGAGRLAAQDPSPPSVDPADVSSPDAILRAVYDVISGAAGEERDWDRFRSLFVPGARLIPTGQRQTGTSFGHGILTPEEYIERSGPFLVQNGFFESEIHRVTERHGPVVHAFSTYESRSRADDPEPFTRGINSFQLFFDGERWWVLTIYWFGESDDHPIPPEYLPGG